MRIPIAVSLLCLAQSVAAAAPLECPPCGPRYCLDDPDVAKALGDKKARLRQRGYPERLVALLDREAPCIGCIVDAPDAFHVKIVYKPGAPLHTLSIQWTPALERQLREDLRKGRIAAFYIFNADSACACCKGLEGAARADWDPNLEQNTNQVLPFRNVSELGTDPDDLKEPSPMAGLDNELPLPPAEDIAKPRQMHASCGACTDKADARNAAADAVWEQERIVARHRREHLAVEAMLRQTQRRITKLYVEGKRIPKELSDRLKTQEQQMKDPRQVLEESEKELRRLRDDLAQKENDFISCETTACVKAAAASPPPKKDEAPPSPRFRAAAELGANVGIVNTFHQFDIGVLVAMRIVTSLPLYVVFAPYVGVASGFTLSLPAGVHWEFALPWFHLVAVARLMVGYQGHFGYGTDDHWFMILSEAQILWPLPVPALKRFFVAFTPLSLPILFGSPGAGVAYRLAVSFGVTF